MVSLLAESWTWYAFAILIASVRYISRYIQLGSLKAFEVEDYAMLGVIAFYTVLIVSMNVVVKLSTNLLYPGEIIDPDSIPSRIHGSKLTLVVEQSMILLIWGCKACLLLLYNKLTFGLRVQLCVKIVAAYCTINFVVMEVLYWGVWCRPVQSYWQVPVDNIQCSAAIHHLTTNAVFNISSDVMMLCIPLPLLLKSQLPRAKKFILCGLFGLGGFVILSAVLNKYYSFKQPFAPTWTFWYIREASTAILVANIPQCWPLIRRIFNLRSFHGSSDSNGRTGTNTSRGPLSYGRSKSRRPANSIPLGSIPQSTPGTKFNNHNTSKEHPDMDSTWFKMGSQEDILPSDHLGRRGSLEIWKTEVFVVESEVVGSSQGGSSKSTNSSVTALGDKPSIENHQKKEVA